LFAIRRRSTHDLAYSSNVASPRGLLRAVAERAMRPRPSRRAAVAEKLAAALSAGEPLHLALVQPPREVAVADESLPAGLRDIEVASASAADFDALLGGDQ
jgi:hypothetical protein